MGETELPIDEQKYFSNCKVKLKNRLKKKFYSDSGYGTGRRQG